MNTFIKITTLVLLFSGSVLASQSEPIESEEKKSVPQQPSRYRSVIDYTGYGALAALGTSLATSLICGMLESSTTSTFQGSCADFSIFLIKAGGILCAIRGSAPQECPIIPFYGDSKNIGMATEGSIWETPEMLGINGQTSLQPY